MTDKPEARLSIVAYRPKPGKEADLLALTREHVPYLRSLELVTSHPHFAAQAADGTVVEIFEWAEGGQAQAHGHPGVADLWARYSEACEFVPLNTLAEAGEMFANFVPLTH